MTPQESFRLGFLTRCAEEGCDVEEIRGRVKLASALIKFADIIPREVRDLGSAGWAAAKGLMTLPLHATLYGMATSGALGAGAGYGLAKLQNADVDPEEAKRQELISAYQLQAELARRRAQQRSYRRQAPAAPRLF